MGPFTVFDDEVLPLDEILELVDYDENHPEETFFRQQGNLAYREFLARLADNNFNSRNFRPTPPPLPEGEEFPLLRGFTDAHPFRDRKIKPRKKKNCSKGHQCGFSCVAKGKVCKADMTTAQLKAHNAAKRAERKAAKVTQGGGGAGGIQHKPFMSEADAAEYVKGSMWENRTFFHGTSGAGADAITGDGIDINANTSAFYGRGFYMGATGANDGLDTATGYAIERNNAQVLEMKVRVNNPATMNAEQFKTFVKEEVDAGNIPKLKVDFETGAVNQDYMDGVTSALKSKGFDALYLSDFDFAIAFEPQQVAVYNRFDANNPPKSARDKVAAEQKRLAEEAMTE